MPDAPTDAELADVLRAIRAYVADDIQFCADAIRAERGAAVADHPVIRQAIEDQFRRLREADLRRQRDRVRGK